MNSQCPFFFFCESAEKPYALGFAIKKLVYRIECFREIHEYCNTFSFFDHEYLSTILPYLVMNIVYCGFSLIQVADSKM